MLWQHGEESLNIFLKELNNIHETIKFTADYSSDRVNFLDVEVLLRNNKILTDLYVKKTDTHQYLDFSSCHPRHCKTSIPYSQALRLNRICSEPEFFDQRCNQLEDWLIKRGYDEKLVRRKVLDARGQKREELLDRNKFEKQGDRMILNITYHPAFQSVGKILRKIHVLLACNKEHQEVFSKAPIVGFRKGKSLKDLLVRAKVPELQANNGHSARCGGKRCGVCNFVKETDSFSDRKGRRYEIRSGIMCCNSDHIVYLLNCKTCGVQYVGSCTTKFRLRFNNYKSCHNRCKKQTVMQADLHDHFCQADHNSIQDWEFILIDRGENLESVRKRERFWQYKLNTFVPEGLNDREVATSF